MKMLGMIACKDVMDKLWDYLDGELEQVDEAAIRRHLEICDLCYPQFDFQRAYFQYLQLLRSKESAPPDLRRRLFDALMQEAGKMKEGGEEAS